VRAGLAEIGASATADGRSFRHRDDQLVLGVHLELARRAERQREHAAGSCGVDETPDLSLVAAFRNEQYGGDLFGRARSFLRNVAWLSRREHVSTEVILVEWCPLPGRPSLSEVLSGTYDPLSIRIVTVPTETASRRFANADVIPLWIFAAKNVGVRRARAPFVLATNPDVLFTPALLRAIGKGGLDENSFYRTSRYDVANIPLDARPRTQLRRCRRSIVRVNLLGGSVRFKEPSAGLRVARAVRRYLMVQEPTRPSTREDAAARPTDWIHTNASGDFFLMHRRRWDELGGYPEFASAGHLDSYICVMAASAGMNQVVLNGRRRLYHLEHARAVDWEHQENAVDYVVPYETFLEAAKEMLLAEKPTVFNDASWGFADLELPEATPRA
jgi:hypothetical protein